MESFRVPLIAEEDWESLCCLCTQESQQITLIEHLHGLTTEWHRYFAGCYTDPVTSLSLSSRSSLATGILKVNAEQYAYGAVLKVTIRDPAKYYTAMTRFIVVYMDEKLTVSKISRSTIEPKYAEEFVQPGQVKK